MNGNIKFISVITLILVFLLFIPLNFLVNDIHFEFSQNTVTAEPIVLPNPDRTETAIWDFDDPYWYEVHNATISNGEVNLLLKKYWLNQTTQVDFDSGYFVNTTSTPTGEVIMISGVNETNLICTGDFSWDDPVWIYSPSFNILSQHNATDENAEFKYDHVTSYHTVYLNPANNANEEDGTVFRTIPSPPGMIGLDRDLEYTEVGRGQMGVDPTLQRSFFYFDTSSIPDSAIIDKVTFWAFIRELSESSRHQINISTLDEKNDLLDPGLLLIDCINGSLYIEGDPSMNSEGKLGYHEWELGPLAIYDLQINLSRNWFGIGISEVNESKDQDPNATFCSNESNNPPRLNVSFWNPLPPITFDETAYLNQTFNKPRVTPNSPWAVNLSFDYSVEKFQGSGAELAVKIDDIAVWSTTMSSTSPWNTVYLDLSQYMTEPKDYNISFQLHKYLTYGEGAECLVKIDDVNITAIDHWMGDYTSIGLEAGSRVFWDEISWYSITPSETDFTIRTRSRDGPSAPWGDWSDEYQKHRGDQITSSKGTHMQYTINMSTRNIWNTPEMHDVNISYEKYCRDGYIEMKNDYIPQNLGNWGNFSCENQTNGQNITCLYSIDSGSTWYEVPDDGDLSSIDIMSGKIRFKAEFNTSDTTVTPTLFKWNLTYVISRLPSLFGAVNPGYGYISTRFNFTVNYLDFENDAPLNVNVSINITKGGLPLGNWKMSPSDPSDDDYTDGKLYYFVITNFERGSDYLFYFAAQDPINGLWNTSEMYNGPYVINSPPMITSSNDEFADLGVPYSVDYEAVDLEGDVLEWKLKTNASTWLSINSANGVLQGTPNYGEEGIYWVNVTVKDGNGGLDWTNFTLNVYDTIIPTANAGEDVTSSEDAEIQFDGSLSADNTNQISNYTWYFGDGTIGYGTMPTHIYTNQGNYVVVLIVRDPFGNLGYDIMAVTIDNVPPVANAGPDKINDEGEEVYFNASGSYDTTSDILELVYLWDFDEDGEFDDGVGVRTSHIWYEDGRYNISLKVVDDNGNYSIDDLTLTIENSPPEVNLDGPYSGHEGSGIYFYASAYDQGNDDVLYSWDWDNDDQIDTGWSSRPHSMNIWPKAGTYQIAVHVMDGDGGYGSDIATVYISVRKIPPIVEDLGTRQIHFDENYTIDLSHYISDEDTPMNALDITTSDPDHTTVDGLVLTLRYPFEMSGQTAVVEVYVDDGTFTASANLTVIITDNYPPNRVGAIDDVIFYEDNVSENVFNLNDHFKDKDTGDSLTFMFESSEPDLLVIIDGEGWVTFRASPNWYGNATVRFIAKDPKEAFDEDEIFVNVIPVNDPPIILRQIRYKTIEKNQNWSIDLDNYFIDVDNYNLTFVCNNPEVQIDLITHEAIWVPEDNKKLENVIFTATDGEYSVSLDPVDLKVVQPIVSPFNWLYVILAVFFTALVFVAYREVRYRYRVEEVFLVNNAGMLLVHISRGEAKSIDALLVSGMLTAVQEFVRDSFRKEDESEDAEFEEGTLGKLEYGDFQIVIERGVHTFLSAVISGYDNKRLRRKMRDVINKFETTYLDVLEDWDGDMMKFEGSEAIVGKLIKKSPPTEKTIEEEIGPENDDIIDEEYDKDTTEELPSGDFSDIPSYHDESGKRE